MIAKMFLVTLLLATLLTLDASAQVMPLVYDVENTCADCPVPYLPSFSELPVITSLPDPYKWIDGRGRISNYSDWRYRRAEISAQIQQYEIGEKPPRPDSIQASYAAGVLTVNVTLNGQTLTLTSQVILPSGTGPFPAVIGINSYTGSLPSTIFSSRNIAQIRYNHNQVTTYGSPSNTNPYYRLYPHLNIDNTGQYSAWAWGVSRIIDGLELVQDVLPIDLQHVGVTGCSYAGKMALFAGALDERIALTIAQESGGGGATSWRYSHTELPGTVESLESTDHNWFRESMFQFGSDNVSKLPIDHHELMALCAPRALLVTGNTDYTWLSNPSCHVCSRACLAVYYALGIGNRFGFSINGGHSHCQVPSSLTPEIIAFVDKYLLGSAGNSFVATTPFNINLTPWITWTAPTLGTDTTYFTKLVYPHDSQSGLDTNITLRWKKVDQGEEYFVQISTSPAFLNIVRSDSTSDTSKTFAALSDSTRYYWRVQVRSAAGLGPWSSIRTFVTTVSSPTVPQLVSTTSDQTGYVRFVWRNVEAANHYLLQVSYEPTFATIFSFCLGYDHNSVVFSRGSEAPLEGSRRE